MELLIQHPRTTRFKRRHREHSQPVSILVDRSTQRLKQAIHEPPLRDRSKHMCLCRRYQIATGMQRLRHLQWLPMCLGTPWHQRTRFCQQALVMLPLRMFPVRSSVAQHLVSCNLLQVHLLQHTGGAFLHQIQLEL